MAIDWKPLVELVKRHRSFVLTTHMRADCDALGSELAMAAALETLGKEVRVINGDAVPPHIAFIDPRRKVEVFDPAQSSPTPEVLMVLDTSAWQQLGPLAEVIRNTSAQKVVIDHHVSSDDLGAIEFKDTKAEATGRLVLSLIEALGVEVTAEMGVAMFAAIATDTGWFRFNSVTAETFQAAAKLVAAGARPADLFALLYEQHTLARLKMHGLVIEKVKLHLNNRYATSTVTLQDLVATGAETTDTEDVVNRLLTVAGVEVAALFVELEPKKIKISLRSRAEVDVRKVAEEFGGGGHNAAAGIRILGTLAEAEQALLDAMRKAMP